MRRLGHAHGRQFLKGLGWAVVLSLATTFLSHEGYLRNINLIWLDALFSVARPLPPGAVRVITCDDNDFRRLGYPTPPTIFPRRKLAAGLRSLADTRPRLIALDLFLDARSGEPGADDVLVRALADIRAQGIPVVVAGKLGGENTTFVPPLPQFGRPRDCGFANLASDEDEVVRAVPEGATVSGRPVYSFAGRVAQRLRTIRGWGEKPERDEPEHLAFGDFVPINFSGAGAGAVGGLSFADLVERRLAPELLAGKVVVVGRSDTAAGDFHLVPPRSSSAVRARVPGVHIQAACINTLAGRAALKHATVASDLAAEIGAGTLVVCLLLLLGSGLGTLAALLLVLVVAVPASVFLLDSANYWLNLVPTVLGVVAHGLVEDRREQGERRTLFEGLVGPGAARVLLRQRHDPLSPVLLRDVVVVLTDLAASSQLARQLGPAGFRDAVQVYYGHVCEAAWRHGGLVNQFLGDGVMCLFGALPHEQGDPAERALAAAKEMAVPTPETVARWRQKAATDLRLRVAVMAGPAVVGNLGTPRRFCFTAVGDTVNTVFRMIHLPHGGSGTHLWVAEDVLTAHDPGWQVARTHSLNLPGQEAPLTVCELDSSRPTAGPPAAAEEG